MQCFFDGSRASLPTGETWLTLAGFMASDGFWKRFNAGWTTEVLRKREPHAPYLHMRKLYSSTGDYAGFTKERWNMLVIDAVHYLQSQPKKAFCAIVCGIDETARRDLVAQGCAISESHHICTDWSVARSFRWYYDTLPDGLEPAYVHFDQDEVFMHHFRQRWLKEMKTQRVLITNTFWGSVVDITTKDMRNTPALQASDLFAWSETRYRASPEDRPFRYLAKILRAVVPSWRLLLDRETLRRKHFPPVIAP